MKRKITNKVVIVLLMILVNITLSGCAEGNYLSSLEKKLFVGKEIDKTIIKEKRIEEVDIILKNTLDQMIYADYEVKLFDDKQEVLCEKKYDLVCFSEKNEKYINIGDIKPDYITYSRIKYADVKVNNVYECNKESIIDSLMFSGVIFFVFLTMVCISIRDVP